MFVVAGTLGEVDVLAGVFTVGVVPCVVIFSITVVTCSAKALVVFKASIRLVSLSEFTVFFCSSIVFTVAIASMILVDVESKSVEDGEISVPVGDVGTASVLEVDCSFNLF